MCIFGVLHRKPPHLTKTEKIDEAYAMDVKSSTGRNVMNHLVAEMTERLGRLVVVMTGYENEKMWATYFLLDT